MNESHPWERTDPPYARYTLTMPCAWCDNWTTFYTNDRQHAAEVLKNGRLCADCHEEQERTREKMEVNQ